MRYRTRRRTPGFSLSFVLALFGFGVGVVGLLSLSAALYLIEAVSTVNGTSEEFTSLVVGPIDILYQGGFLTVGIGVVFTLVGSGLVVTR